MFSRTFQGAAPALLVSDPEWLKEAFIKNFAITTDRFYLFMGGVADYGIFNIGGEHWKYVRTMLSPTFTQGKLKKVRKVFKQRNVVITCCLCGMYISHTQCLIVFDAAKLSTFHQHTCTY